MTETHEFLNRMKQEGLISADVTCGKEHVVIHAKGIRTGHDSKAFQQVKTQLMKRTKVGNRTLIYILAGVFVLAILISLLDSNVSGFYRSVFSSGTGVGTAADQSVADLSTAALTSLDEAGKTRELLHSIHSGNLPRIRKLLELGANINGLGASGDTPLVAALESGRKDAAALLLNNGASLDTPAKSGVTPVMIAAKKGERMLLDQLLKNGAKLKPVDKKGNSALAYAVQGGSVPCAVLVLKRNTDPNRPNGDGRAPLLVAAAKGNTAMCDMLIKAGAKVDMPGPKGTTPLMEAAGTGHIQLVRKLLSAGARIDAVSKTGDTALAVAARKRHADMVHLLLATAVEKKATFPDAVSVLNHALEDKNTKVAAQMVLSGIRKPLPIPPLTAINLKSWTVYRELLRKTLGEKASLQADEKLQKAVQAGKSKQILAALKEGADPAATNKNKDNSVMLAVRNHQLAALKTLINYGAPVEAIGQNNGESPLLIGSRLKDPRFTTLLLQAGANPNKPGLNGHTAMDFAFATGNRMVIPILATGGALAVTELNKNQWTPLEFVIANGKTDMLDMLIRNAADIDKTDANGWSALHYAIMLGKPALVDKLLKKRANINLRDKMDWNPLHFAVLVGRLDILKILIAAGAKVNRRNDVNWSPLYLAIALRHPDMTKALLKAGAKTRYKSNRAVALPPFSFPTGIRAEGIIRILLKKTPKNPIVREIQTELR